MKRAHVACLERKPFGHQLTWGGAFAEGLRRHGWEVTISGAPCACDLLVMWGVRRGDWIKRQKAAGGEVCILERGYVGDRFQWTSVSFGGGLNGRGEFRGPFDDGSRWKTHFAELMQPWRQKDGPIIVMGQVPGDNAVKHMDIDGWCRRTVEAFKSRGRHAYVRHHPKCRAGQRPLADALAEASMAVTYNSNSAVDAVLAGVPTITMDHGSMAWAVTGHDVTEDPPMPDRTAWANRLAWCQWRMDEMRAGECWAAIRGAKSTLHVQDARKPLRAPLTAA